MRYGSGSGNLAGLSCAARNVPFSFVTELYSKDDIMSKASIRKKISTLRSILMYPCLISVFVFMLSSQAASAGQADIGWNADSGSVSGYDVHYGTSSGNYTSTLDAGNTTSATLQSLAAQTYYVAVSAYDAGNDQSPLSSELVIDSITASAASGGSISPSGNFFQPQGASQPFTITPASGYVISNVTVDGTSVGAVSSYTLSDITASHTVSATFAAQTPTTSSYTISATAGSNGSISPSGSVGVNSGASQTFAITPASGCKVAAVLVDGASVGAVSSYTFSDVTANHTISATFTASVQSSYSITSTAGSNGSISPSGTVSVASGANQTFSITPSSGYKVSSVQVDGTSIGSVTSYTFSRVSANHTISAAFSSGTLPPIADAGPNQTLPEGDAVTLSGANSTDVGGPGIASYKWVQTGGQAVTLSAPTSVTTTFKTPSKAGALTFQLTVTDKNGVTATSACIVNSSSWYTTAPVASAGADQTVGVGAVVALDGWASTGPADETSDVIKTYLWQQVDGPAVKLSNAAAAAPTFTAPQATGGYASMCFLLTVTDSLGLESTDFCFVNIDPTASAASAPKTVVGAEQSVNTGTTVKLSGSGSTASNGIAAYRWRETGGTPVKLSDPTSSIPTFTASKYSGTYGDILTFTLIVQDKNGLRSKAHELVTVN